MPNIKKGNWPRQLTRTVPIKQARHMGADLAAFVWGVPSGSAAGRTRLVRERVARKRIAQEE